MKGLKQDRSIQQLGIKQDKSRHQLGQKSYGFHNSNVVKSNTLMAADSSHGIQSTSKERINEPMGLYAKSKQSQKWPSLERAPRKDKNGYNVDKNYVT